MKTKLLPLAVLVLTSAGLFPGGLAHGATFDHQVQPRKNDGFRQALFRLWLPDAPGPVRGMIVESGQGGKPCFDDAAWQELARKHQLAILCHTVTGTIPHNKEGYEQGPIYEPPFYQAVQELATVSKHPELPTLPLLTFGPCRATDGGFFPWRQKTSSVRTGQRVVAFAATDWYQTGPGFAKTRIAATLRDIPGVLLVRRNVEAQFAAVAKDIFEANRKLGAPWAVAVASTDKSPGHGLIRAFFDAVWTQRVPPPATATTMGAKLTAAVPLKPVDEGKGWLGDLKTGEIATAITYTRPRNDAAWFPDEASAMLWKRVVFGE